MRNFKVQLTNLVFKTPFDRGPETMRFKATLDGTAFGPAGEFTRECRNSATIDLATFSTTIDLDARPIESGQPKPVVLTLNVSSAEPGGKRSFDFRHTFRYPFIARSGTTLHVQASLAWTFEQEVPAADPNAQGNPAVDICRETANGNMRSTVGSPDSRFYVEVHPVLPHRGGCEPVRPAFPAGTLSGFTSDQGVTAQELINGNLNVIWNPSVIPILPDRTTLDDTNCARFRVTFFRPRTLQLKAADDDRLEWRVQPVTGGEARFFGPTNGRICKLHGVREGEVMLELRFRGAVVAIYRVLVANLLRIPARMTILSVDPNDPAYTDAADPNMSPTVTPADVEQHLGICSKFWWQAGIQLYPDPSNKIGRLPAGILPAAVTATPRRGVFTAQVSNDLTINIGGNQAVVSAFNAVELVANFVYIVSTAGGILGEACLRESQGNGSVSDSGTPSTSWVKPCGVPPDSSATTKTMKIRQEGIYNAPLDVAVAAPAWKMRVKDIYSMYLQNHPNLFEYVTTMSHELGHILNLMHRSSTIDNPVGSNDTLEWPLEENLMHDSNPAELAQDIDFLQAKVARNSLLCQRRRRP